MEAVAAMSSENPFDAFTERLRVEQDQLRDELQSYHPSGVMRLWSGRSTDHLVDVTAKRVGEIEREIARAEAIRKLIGVLREAL
jgi:hypothetical protein